MYTVCVWLCSSLANRAVRCPLWVQLAVHWWCYLPFSIVSGWHIQYMTHPPSQLKKHGGLYRMVGLIGYFIFTLITSAGVTWYTSSASPEA